MTSSQAASEVPSEREAPAALPERRVPQALPQVSGRHRPHGRSSGDRIRGRVRQACLERLTTLYGAAHARGPAARSRLRSAIAEVITEVEPSLGAEEAAALAVDIADELTGFGPIQPLLDDPGIVEVMVNGHREVWVERAGRLEKTGICLESPAALRHLIERIVGPLGLRVDDTCPIVDARLPDGSRFHAVLSPVARHGPVVTIRKFVRRRPSRADLVSSGALTIEAWSLVASAVRSRANVVVGGGTSSGKTTMLNVLAGLIPSGERLVTVEDAAELQLPQEHVVSLESRPPNIDGSGEVRIRDLVRAALRMRPDRIIVGEVRGGEALDMLQAMNTGHEGSLTTAHANGTSDLMLRLETMVLMADVGLSEAAVRQQLASAIDLVIHMARRPDGSRSVCEICETGSWAPGFADQHPRSSSWPPLRKLFVRPPGAGSTLEQIARPDELPRRLAARGHEWREVVQGD